MGKRPRIDRDTLSGALTTECAAKWYAFLAEEAYFKGDMEIHDTFMVAAESLSQSPQGFLHSQKLEGAIKKWCEK